MISRPYNPEQYSILEEWWKGHGWHPVGPDLLPHTGFIVWQGLQPLAAGFLYLTDSRFAILDWVLSAPKSDRIERGQALDLLLDSLIQAARDNDKSTIFTTSKHPKLLERYKAKGFVIGDEQMTTLIGRI
jgi:hypothetical protein